MPEFTPYPVELITPEGIVFSGDAERVVVPGAAGELGILGNHAPLISLLQPGETRVTDADGTVRSWYKDGINAGTGGLLRYYPHQELDVVVLANSAEGAWPAARRIHDLVRASAPTAGEYGLGFR